MQPERGTQTVIGIVLAVTLLWTIAILIPGGGRVTVDPNRAFATPQLGLVINGTHYVLDANVRRYQAGDDENFHIIHAQSPEKAQRKLKVAPKSTKTASLQSQPSSRAATQTKTSQQSSSNQKKRPLFPRVAWFGLFIVYHARRFVKRRRATYEEDWFVKSGLDANLEYYGARQYEDDFLSVDGSFYGTMNKWNGEELNKFDYDDDHV